MLDSVFGLTFFLSDLCLIFRSDLLSGTGSPGGRDQKISWTRYMRTLLREEIIVLIFLRFVGQYMTNFLQVFGSGNFLILVYKYISSASPATHSQRRMNFQS
jgi:hypothetical protein